MVKSITFICFVHVEKIDEQVALSTMQDAILWMDERVYVYAGIPLLPLIEYSSSSEASSF